MTKMYNLLVSGNEEAWSGEPWILEEGRCAREYTDKLISIKFRDLNQEQVNLICKMPCILAYEAIHKKNPLFGVIRDVVRRQGQVRIEYKVIKTNEFITHLDLINMSFELDISVKGYELNRTHWAIKNVDMQKELLLKGIDLSEVPIQAKRTGLVDITKHDFQVALSFPGEHRQYVECIAKELEPFIRPNGCFYDKYYTAQLARPSLDILLQDIYRNRSDLIVVFLCRNYQDKEWCNLEFRAIREIMKSRQNHKVMFVKLDSGKVEGVFETDGFIDAQQFTPAQIAKFISERVELLQNH